MTTTPLARPRIEYGRDGGRFWWTCLGCGDGGTARRLSRAYIDAGEHLEASHADE